MNLHSAAIFGFNEYARQIIEHVRSQYKHIAIFVISEEEKAAALQGGYGSEMIDLSDDWDGIKERFKAQGLVVFCALADDAENVFLTISLRAAFEHLYIIALAQNGESVLKMKSAGANKVLPSVEIAANIIVDMLEKPVVTKVLRSVIYEDNPLNVIEIKLGENSFLCGKYLNDIYFRRDYDVILLGIVDQELGTTFNFASKGLNHHIDAGDILVVMGYQEKLDELIRVVGEEDNG